MSVINRMLQTLDERHVKARLPNMVRAVPLHLPKTQHRFWLWGTPLFVILLLVGVFIWLNVASLSKPAVSVSAPTATASSTAAKQALLLRPSASLEFTELPPTAETETTRAERDASFDARPASAAASASRNKAQENESTQFLLRARDDPAPPTITLHADTKHEQPANAPSHSIKNISK